MCHRCDGDSERAKGGGACKECSGAEVMEWWMLSEEEAAYMHSAFPVGQTSIDHILLQCPECKSVNFPGTEQCLIINRGGQMTSQSVAFPPAPSCPLLPPPAPPAPAAPPDERAGLSGSDAACALNPKPETQNPKPETQQTRNPETGSRDERARLPGSDAARDQHVFQRAADASGGAPHC